MEVLERGGSAVDAALAMQAMLSLVEPQSSGVGGGGFVNFYDARDPSDHDLRRARSGPGAGHADHVPRPRRQAIAIRASRRSAGVRPACPGRWRRLRMAYARAWPIAMEQPVPLRRTHRRRGVHRHAAAGADGGRQIPPEFSPRRPGLFRPGSGRRAGQGRRPAEKSRLRRLPPPARRSGHCRALHRQHRGEDRRAHPRRTAWRIDDHGRPCRLSTDQARRFVRGRGAPIVPARRRRPRAGVGLLQLLEIARTHRHRQARADRPAGLVSVRRGQPPDVRRPRPICRRSGVRRGRCRGIAQTPAISTSASS